MSAGASVTTIHDAPAVEGGQVPASVQRVEYRHWDGQCFEPGIRALPSETPVALRVNCTDYAVMLATPLDLADFAHGLMRAEGLIASSRDVRAVEIAHGAAGTVVHAEIAGDAGGGRARRLAGATGCGLCGVERLDDVLQAVPSVGGDFRISARAIVAAMEALRDWQPLNAASGALHAAAFADGNGHIVTSREDVGRHNALDKLIGALLRSGVEPGSGFIAMTSRCSFELVQKAAAFGCAVLVTAGAPTALARQLAGDAGMTLVACARGGRFLAVAGAARIDD